MKTKLIALICLLSLIITSYVPFSAYAADEANNEAIAQAKQFLSQLNINNDITSDDAALITRAEFAALVARALNADYQAVSQSPFADIEGNAFSKEISLLYELGLTNGTSEFTFTPEGKVAQAVAAKMLVCALDFGSYAEALGGFPTGYLKLADTCDLFDGVYSSSDALTVGNAYVMVNNALVADKAIFTSLNDGDVRYETERGRCLLTDNFGLTHTNGVVTSADLFGVNAENVQKGKIGISNAFYHTLLDTREYLGMEVDLWYDKDDNTAYAISESLSNKQYLINAKDIEDYNNYILGVVDESDKIKNYKFDKGFSYIENGRGKDFTKTLLEFENGSLKLIDNDDDGDIDYVIAEKVEYFVISVVDYVNNIIYDPDSAITELEYRNDDTFFFEIVLDGKKAKMSDLAENMALEVMQSSDGEVCCVRASSKVIDATLDGMSEGVLMIGDTEYETNSYFESVNKDLILGREYTFCLSADMTITAAFLSDGSGYKYAMYLNYSDGHGFGNSKIKLLTEAGLISVLDVSEKICLNGTDCSSKDADFKNLLLSGRTPLYQLIRYKERNGSIIAIDTTTDSLTNWDFDVTKDADNSLTRYLKNKNIYYYGGSYNYGSPAISFTGALLIRVPSNYDDTVSEIEDDEFFVINSSYLTSDEGHILDVYDFDDSMSPAVILVRESGKTDDVKVPPRGNKSYVLTDITDVVDEDGDIAKKMKVFYNDMYEEFLIKPEIYDKMTDKPGKGDVIRFTLDAEGYVDGLCIDVDYTYKDAKHNFTVNYGKNNVQSEAHHYFTYYTGTVYSSDSKSLIIDIDKHPTGSYWFDIPGGIMRIGLLSPVYIEYNVKTGQAKAVKPNMLKSIKLSGAANADAVVCRMVYGCANTVISYTD